MTSPLCVLFLARDAVHYAAMLEAGRESGGVARTRYGQARSILLEQGGDTTMVLPRFIRSAARHGSHKLTNREPE